MSSSSAAHLGKVTLALVAATLAASTPDALAAHRLSDGGGLHRLIVTFHARASADARQAALADAGVTAVRRIDRLNMVVVRGSQAAEDALSQADAVAYSELDRTVHAAATPNDPLFTPTVSPCSSSFGCWPYASLKLPDAWSLTSGSTTTVAVVDSGVSATHPDLAQVVLSGYNFVAGNTNADDDNGHGTMVSGVIAARQNNGIGIPGVCGACRILPVKVLAANGSGSTSTVAQGIQWAADHGARVINLSLAGTSADPALSSAIAYANTKGALVVAAAGNSGSNNPAAGSTGGYPAAFTSTITTGLVSVAGVDASNALYSWSNHGSWVTVAAPGAATVPTTGGGYSVAYGTSIAAPFVSGVAGLALSVAPSLSVSALQSALTSTVTKTAGLDDATGGVVNAAALVRSLGVATAPTAPAPTAPAPTAPAPTMPAPSAAPAITGVARVGHTLTSTAGSWSGTGLLAYRYQWQSSKDRVSWTTVSGATSSSYAVTTASAGEYLRITVTATGPAGSAASPSVSTDKVGYDAPAIVTAPVVSGSAVVGSLLSANAGTWSNAPTTYAYQWQSSADGTAWRSIAGAVHAQYAIGAGDLGLSLRVTVAATNASGSATSSSAGSARVRPHAPSLLGSPVLGGTARVGGTLTATPGTWKGTAPLTISYQWQVSTNGSSWTTVAGTDARLTVPSSAKRAYVRVRVTVANAAGSASAASAAVKIAS